MARDGDGGHSLARSTRLIHADMLLRPLLSTSARI
uniref:Uncharacterized protein n=1 Tax=Rhizophora mucronata TaxID=61149 RepID=A0A2P2NAR0_RHIMU